MYEQNSNYISKPFSERKLRLSDGAKSTVLKTVADFEKNVRRAKKEFEKVEISPLKTSLYYKHISKMLYDYLAKEYRKAEKPSRNSVAAVRLMI